MLPADALPLRERPALIVVVDVWEPTVLPRVTPPKLLCSNNVGALMVPVVCNVAPDPSSNMLNEVPADDAPTIVVPVVVGFVLFMTSVVLVPEEITLRLVAAVLSEVTLPVPVVTFKLLEKIVPVLAGIDPVPVAVRVTAPGAVELPKLPPKEMLTLLPVLPCSVTVGTASAPVVEIFPPAVRTRVFPVEPLLS
jgi:hypothetical protein